MPVSLGTIYNPYRAQHSKEYAYECWKDYTYGTNKLKISEEDMEILTEKYSKELNKWEKAATEDVTIYEIEDDFDLSELDKTEAVKTENKNSETNADSVEETVEREKVEKPDMANQKNTNMAAGISAAGTAAAGVGTAAAVACGAWSYGLMAGCYVALAVGILYQATRPNQQPRDALMTLREQMLQLQSSLTEGQEQLDALSEALATGTDDMQGRTDEKQKQIAEKEKLYQTCLGIYTAIYEKVLAGEQVTDAEKAQLTDCGNQLIAMGKEIAVLKAEFEADKEEMSAYVEDQSSVYEENAEVMADSGEATNLAESFDEQTEEMIKWQVASQTVNAAAGIAMGTAALAIGWMAPPYMVAGFAGITGGALSLAGVIEQSTYLDNVKTEISDRVVTQNNLDVTTNSFNESISTYQSSVGTVNEQNLEISGGLLTAENFEVVSIPDTQSTTTSSDDDSNSVALNQTSLNPFAQTTDKEPEIKNPFA